MAPTGSISLPEWCSTPVGPAGAANAEPATIEKARMATSTNANRSFIVRGSPLCPQPRHRCSRDRRSDTLQKWIGGRGARTDARSRTVRREGLWSGSPPVGSACPLVQIARRLTRVVTALGNDRLGEAQRCSVKTKQTILMCEGLGPQARTRACGKNKLAKRDECRRGYYTRASICVKRHNSGAACRSIRDRDYATG